MMVFLGLLSTRSLGQIPVVRRRARIAHAASAVFLFLLCTCGNSENIDSSRPEHAYGDRRVADEFMRLEQNAQIEEVLGHDTRRLTELLEMRKDIPSSEAKDLLVRCRDEYLKGLKNKSGVPLGGMGAGTIELWPDGGLHDWRIEGNWDLAKEAELSFFAVRTQSPGKSPRTRILQDAPWARAMRTTNISYEGRFPLVLLDYGSGKQPVSVKARALSPFIPHDAENSCLPVAHFVFEVTNNSEQDVHLSLLAAVGVSPFLEDGVSRFEEIGEISLLSHESSPNAIALSTTAANVSYAAGWTRQQIPDGFQALGRLQGNQAQENGRIALCIEIDLEPGKSADIPVLLSWYFPDQRQRPTHGYEMEVKFEKLGTTQELEANKYIGRHYNKFGSLSNVNAYFFENLPRLEQETLMWVNSIYDSSLDDSLKSLLCNSLYPLFKTSFWTEDGTFNILESTNCCANPDCVHVRYYGSIPLALLFPELDQQILRRLAKYRGPFGGEEAGLIPEQFYGFSLELPFGRPLLQNNLSFVMMVYRDYLWTGDEVLLKDLWPAVQEAMNLLLQKDTDDDGLLDNVGIKQSYDDYDMGDSPIYISGIWLACLRAAEEMALRMGDQKQAGIYQDAFIRGRNSVDSALWNGEYYQLADGERPPVCFADALNGQWYADMLGLGDLLDKDRIQSTLAAIFRYNDPATPYGIVNGFVPGQGIDYPKQAGYFQTQTASVWTGTTFAVASLGLYRGFHKEPLEAVKEVHDNYALRLGNLWNIRESNDAESGLPMAWPFYYRPMSAWAVLLGLQGFRYDAGRAKLVIQPPADVDNLKAPLIVPGSASEMEFSRREDEIRARVSIRKGLLKIQEIRLPPMDTCSISSSVPGAVAICTPETMETVLRFPAVRQFQSGDVIDLRLTKEPE